MRISGQLAMNIGTLEAAPGQTPRNMQTYVLDAEYQANHRALDDHIHRQTIGQLTELIESENKWAREFKTTREVLRGIGAGKRPPSRRS